LIEEIELENKFYNERGIQNPKQIKETENDSKQEQQQSEQTQSEEATASELKFEEKIGLELVSLDESLLPQVAFRYVLCSVQVSVYHLKKLLALHLFKSSEKQSMVRLCNLSFQNQLNSFHINPDRSPTQRRTTGQGSHSQISPTHSLEGKG